VRETPGGREVAATVVRGGQRTTLQVTPERGSGFAMFNGDLPGRFDLERFNRDFRFDMPRIPEFDVQVNMRPGRLGVSLNELDPQLAEYFGVKQGVLVASVRQDSPAARAGVKAGDVITQVNGRTVERSSDVRRAVGDLDDATEATLTLVRDKKEMTVKVALEEEPERPVRRQRYEV
jgi:serine protease Do